MRSALDTEARQDRLSRAISRCRAAKRALHEGDAKTAIKRVAGTIESLSELLTEIEDASGLEAGAIE